MIKIEFTQEELNYQLANSHEMREIVIRQLNGGAGVKVSDYIGKVLVHPEFLRSRHKIGAIKALRTVTERDRDAIFAISKDVEGTFEDGQRTTLGLAVSKKFVEKYAHLLEI